jgi:nucleoside-diphosphate-sugar epimerase
MAKQLNLVTGACGFTGSHLVKQLLDSGQAVIATDLSRAFEHPKNKAIFASQGIDFGHPKCTVQPSDLTDKKSLAALFEHPVTHVFHTASLYDYSASMNILRKINVEGAVNLFDLAIGHDKLERFIHWSTCGVFGKPYTAADGRKCNIPFTEENPSPKNTPISQDEPAGTHIVNDYSVTKFKQEQIAWQYHREKGLPLTVIRPAPIYGPGSDYGHGGILLAVARGLVPVIPKDAKNYITTSVHVADVAGFGVFAAQNAATLGEDYNVIDDSIISYYEFLHYMALLMGRRMRDLPLVRQSWLRHLGLLAANVWLVLEKRFGVPRVRILEKGSATYMSSSYWISNAKSKKAGYTYKYPDVKEGLRETVDWFRRMGWLDPDYNPKAIWQENLK